MTQKELKPLYLDELRKTWDERMAQFCLKKTAYIVHYDGCYFGIEKPEIEKDFCFGYGYCGRSDTEDEADAEAMARTAETSEAYFKRKNLEELDSMISTLENIVSDINLNWAEGSHPRLMVVTGAKYSGQPDDCKLRFFSIVDTYRDSSYNETMVWNVEFLETLIAAYKEVRKAFEKRLNSYLKRYGLSKVNSWTYLRD